MRALATGMLLLSACTTTIDPGSSRQAVGGPKPDLSTPTLSATGATQTSITITVCAGETGAPAGFSVQWKTAADYALNGWASDAFDSYCAASFSGVPGGSSHNLGPYECESVVIGALDDSQVGTSFQEGCNAGLACGTEYVFRTFAHANSDFNRSAFSETITASTAACDNGCTYTQGYWKNHSEAWPVSSLTLGTVSYTQGELLAILGEPVKGNGLISLAHQLIAAELNVASGANASAISATIAAANAMIGGLVVPPVGSGYLAPSSTGALNTALDDWNNGRTGPGHCE
jgi:hypothetical protein